MKRAGFTMIELIFVIVIIGILSAVALPKFIGVSDQAKVAKVVSYAGTLNRTTLPPYWSQSLSEGKSGSIKSYSTNIQSDLAAPSGSTATPDFTKLEANNYVFADGTVPTNIIATWVYGTKTYDLACADGAETTAARCDVYGYTSSDDTTGKWLLKGNQ